MLDYDAADEKELSLSQGDIVEVVAHTSDAWWLGRLNGKLGRFPVVMVDPHPLARTFG